MASLLVSARWDRECRVMGLTDRFGAIPLNSMTVYTSPSSRFGNGQGKCVGRPLPGTDPPGASH